MSDPSGSIGTITASSGPVTIDTGNGTSAPVTVGMQVHLHDQFVTGEGGHLEIKFADGAQFAMSPNSSMDVSKFAFDPDGSDNGLIVNFTHGAFEFVAGKVAHLFGDGMKVETPAGTLGVRGTAAAAREDPVTHQWTYMLLKDPNGHLGKIALINPGGEVTLDHWMQASTMSIGVAPAQPHVMTPAEVHKAFGNAVSMIHELGDQTNRADPPHAQQTWSSHPQFYADGSLHDAQHVVDTHHDTIQVVHTANGTIQIHDFIAGGDETQLAADRGTDLNDDPLGSILGDQGNVQAIAYNDDPIVHHPVATVPDLFGTTGSDTIVDAAGNANYHALSGNDVFSASHSGNHGYDGGSGTDTVDYSGAAGAIHVDLAHGTVSNNGAGGHDILTSIENINGTNHGDYIDARDGIHNVINGGSAHNTFYGDNTDTLNGGSSKDDFYMSVPTTGQMTGGGGLDTWHVINAAGASIDLGALHSAGHIDQIPYIDLAPSNGSSVTLTAADVLSFDSGTEIDIFGNASNTVTSLGQGWSNTGSGTLDGHSMTVWTNGSAIVQIEDTVTMHMS